MTKTVRMTGIPASPGIAIAMARIIDRGKMKTPRRTLSPSLVNDEIDRLMEAVAESRRQIAEARETVKAAANVANGNHALIFDGHLLMLEDELLITGAVALIHSELINAEWALTRKIDEFKKTLHGLGDAFFKERAEDVVFVGNRVLRNLMGYATNIVDAKSGSCVIISETLSPAETTEMIGTPVLAFATDTGTRTSHTAIMAQALDIPAVVGVETLTEQVNVGDRIIVDGNEGVVIIRPDDETVLDYRGRAKRYAELERKLLSARDKPAETKDGVTISLLCNIEFPAEAAMALDYGAEGIGLYRTEFAYLNRPLPPTENEQYQIYRAVVNAMSPRPVVFRTFDLGADKLNLAGALPETNPAMGLRAIRLGLKHREMFKTQLRALLRAADHGAIQIMFPMISGVDELRNVKALLDEAKAELGGEAPDQVRVGCMIELPSAVFIADKLAREVDFFSIGTNDLIQYALAIDRLNDHVAYLYTPFHPGILSAVKHVIDAAVQAGIPVAMCGNMAAESLLIPLLVGFGLRTLSMAPTLIPSVKAMIRTISFEDSRKLAHAVLDLNTSAEVEHMVKAYVEKHFEAEP